MQTDTLKRPIHFDASVMCDLMVNNIEQVKDVFTMIMKELNKSLATLDSSVRNKDLPMLRAEGHKLYGTTLIAGLPFLAELALRFEHLAEEVTAKEIEVLLLKTRKEVQLANQLITNYIQQGQ